MCNGRRGFDNASSFYIFQQLLIMPSECNLEYRKRQHIKTVVSENSLWAEEEKEFLRTSIIKLAAKTVC